MPQPDSSVKRLYKGGRPLTGFETWDKVCRPYAIRVFPRHLESIGSFSERLLGANRESASHRTRLWDAARRLRPEKNKNQVWAEVIAAKGQVPLEELVGHDGPEISHRDGTTCLTCRVGTGDQWMCKQCAGVKPVGLRPHLEYVVCVAHRTWVGSGVAPDMQFEVSDEFIEAEIGFQKLRERGVVDANTLWELLHVIDPTLQDEAEHQRLPHQPFPATIRLWTLLAAEDFMLSFFDPQLTYAQALEFLRAQLIGIGFSDDGLAVRVWHYLRFTALNLREWLIEKAVEETTRYKPHWDHDFRIPEHVAHKLRPAVGPLEPFRRYLEASGTSDITAANWRSLLTHRSAGHTATFVAARAESRRPGVCPAGHRIDITTVLQVGERKSSICPYCSGWWAYPGETDITMTHPARALMFDFERNAPLLPTQVSARSRGSLWWICPLGHSYKNQIKGQCERDAPCPYCDHREPLAGFNTVGDLDPAMTAEWHPTLNDKTPFQLTLRTNEKIWFQCAAGHKPVQSQISVRRRGHGCKSCSLSASRGEPIAPKYPELRSQWDPDLNGGVSFDDAIGTDVDHNWRCERGHITRRDAANRSRQECGLCRGVIKTESVNGLLEKYPLITSEFCEDRNTIARIQMNAISRYWYRCARAGHIRQSTLHQRRHNNGCPDCPQDERIAYGTDEQYVQTPKTIREDDSQGTGWW
ncbi:zinc-ribbon domain-containing protein [Leifsonia sp. Root227]|uniref:zinc-ribbon domain-containing protein n=1 Tax=Leifsonia sp. Root227 TaxID=1736496 RepID=UPI0009EA35A7|nr:zinc-ribbon domain-containing protein [Leifsonia sp. Root227]